MKLEAKFESANQNREVVLSGKAFKKGESAIFIGNWDGESVFYFRRVIVKSCGKVRMTLEDAATGEMMGADFEPSEGFTCKMGFCDKSRGDFRKDFMFCSVGTFKDMTDEEASAICLQLAIEYKQHMLDTYQTQAKRDPNSTAYNASIMRSHDALLNKVPRGAAYYVLREEVKAKLKSGLNNGL